MNSLSKFNEIPEIYPTSAEHTRRWQKLAREIADRRHEIREQPIQTEKPGELVVIGSGIETIGFMLGDDALLLDADHVFYCVADPATVVWIKQLRPDAMDLYVLYDDSKPRYVTYMQMAESMLHYVRAGQRVVCVFYGHPGVFVLSTHRAILIAKREGHRATMRPGVCALDCLCADLGVDPCHPGMQTHEATDMLVRRRKPDSSLHVVLWQVGLIGEMGYRRQGYINKNFSVLIDYLQEFYGTDYPITHYVASRYPVVPPLIEIFQLSELHDPSVQARITGLSTFYLAPRDATQADPEMVTKLGLLKPGQSMKTSTAALREIGSYGPRERKAFDDFAKFSVPPEYHWQSETEASRFLIELRQDITLQRAYAADPLSALQDQRFANLSPTERRMLTTRDAGAIQIAAKGLHRRERSNHALISALLRDRKASLNLIRLQRGGLRVDSDAWLSTYAAENGLAYEAETLSTDLGHLRRHTLLPWTGVYASEELQLSITILGNKEGPGGLLYVKNERINSFTLRAGALEWHAASGAAKNGFIRFDVSATGRRLIGQIWSDGNSRPNDAWFEAPEVDPDSVNLAPLSISLSRYATGIPDGIYIVSALDGRTNKQVTLTLKDDDLLLDGVAVRIEQRSEGGLAWTGGLDEFTQGNIRVSVNPLTAGLELYGRINSASGIALTCVGTQTAQLSHRKEPVNTKIPAWVVCQVKDLFTQTDPHSILLWQKWEKHYLTNRIVHALCTPFNQNRSMR